MATMDKFLRCDSGKLLNPLMHIFLYLTLVNSLAFLLFGDSTDLQKSVLYQQTEGVAGSLSVNAWGLVGVSVVVLHTIAFLIRGKVGKYLMMLAVGGGFYLWSWASAVYLMDGYLFQFLAFSVPNLAFWSWYALQWFYRSQDREVAFVH